MTYFRDFKLLVFLTSLFISIFVLFPNLDLNVSKIFYHKEHSFFWKNNQLILILYNLIPTIVTFLLIFFAVQFVFYSDKFHILTKKEVLYLFLCLAIGPGLVVNTVFKNQLMGRARPSQIVEFGGAKRYSSPFELSKECKKNCSFSSGHASVGFYLSSFAYIAATNRRKTIIYASLIFGVVIGLVRIVQGGHFFSDVIFSGIVVNFVNLLFYKIFYLKRIG